MRLPGTYDDVAALDTDDWYTPPYIIDALGLTYDLDPCSPPGGLPWIPAAQHYTEADDGLIQPWHGRVWLNPPYSAPWPWIEKLAHHGNGIALIPADTSTRGWHRWAITAHSACFLRDRVQFVRLNNDNVTSARFPSVLLAWGEACAAAVRNCQLGWVVTP